MRGSLFGADVLTHKQCVLALSTQKPRAGIYVDEWGIRRAGSEALTHPMEDFGLCELAAFAIPPAPAPESCLALAEAAKRARQTQRGTVILDGGSTYAPAKELLGSEEFFVRLVTDRPFMQELLLRLAQYHAARLVTALRYAGADIDVVRLTDEMGTEAEHPVRPTLFRSIFKPAQQMLVAQLKRMFPEIQVQYRSGGACYSLLPDYADIHYDSWEPLTATCEEMAEIVHFREALGERILIKSTDSMASYGEKTS